ncbi:ABC transporter ATP-binding protein [Oscillospiraceae bacterium HV4-5-C5C]|nr:ABC transporter ATP-binding protein [Oscillospiraceae bacterium HV4-5-C5C]
MTNQTAEAGTSKKERRAAEQSNRRFRNRRLWHYIKQRRAPLLLGFVLTVGAIGADLLGPWIIGRILDGELVEGIGMRLASVFIGMLLAYFACNIAGSALRYGSTWFFQKSSNLISWDMQRDVFNHVQQLPVAYFDNLPAGTVVSRITNDTKAVKVLFDVVLSQLATAVIYGAAIFISLYWIEPVFIILAALPLPLLLWLIRDFKNKSAAYNRDYRRGLSRLNANLNETIQNMEVVQTLNQEARFSQEFKTVNDEVYKQGYNMTKLFSYSAYNATSALQYVVLGLAMLYFGYGQISGRYLVPIGSVYVFIDYMIKFYGQMQNAMSRIGDLERANGAADHIFELLKEPLKPSRKTSPAVLRGALSFETVTFAYKTEKVLQAVDFEVEPGQTVAFVGQTGSGKSTIMNLLFHFYEPQAGRICFDGRPLNELDMDSLRSQMALVLQEPFLFTGTIYSNISLNDPAITREAAEAALREVGGGHLLDRLKDGIMSEVREKGNGYSAGERQLISFARALVRRPRILVLDEATANIDSETEHEIQSGIKTLSRGRTTLIIAHRLSTIKDAQQILVLNQGQIVERGTHDELIAQGGLYYHMYRHQSEESA